MAKIDSLKNPTIRGTVVPAHAGVEVQVEVLRSGTFTPAATAKTDATGAFALSLGYGKGRLAAYQIRARYRVANRDRWEVSGSQTFARIAVLNPVVTPTTAAEVAETYRSGCPVGPSKLQTVRMNYYGRDKKMHRGLLIVRSSLTTEVIRSFDAALAARFPIATMKNPNEYGGNDPRQMEANNTSAFNCRKVVGNPYKQSPHSYGTSIDVNPVQNPYRDINGKWWPDNGRPYIDRSPVRSGMLTTKSTLTKKLRSYGFFWGGLWSPGKDYQHFQHQLMSGAGLTHSAAGGGPREPGWAGLLLAACSLSSPQPSPPATATSARTYIPSATASRMTSPTASPCIRGTDDHQHPAAAATAERARARRRPGSCRPDLCRCRVAGGRRCSTAGRRRAFLGNGTWVHARDPRYAAQDVITRRLLAGHPRRLRRPGRLRLEGNYREIAPGDSGGRAGAAVRRRAGRPYQLLRCSTGVRFTACTTGDTTVRTAIEIGRRRAGRSPHLPRQRVDRDRRAERPPHHADHPQRSRP